MKKLYIFILTLLSCIIGLHTGYAQFDNAATSLPPSANAASLLGQITTPVNMYNGVPIVNADIQTLQTRSDYKIPIFLSYKWGGIKVQDVASTVGLGWSLNTTCLISRVVRGLPDENPNGYFGSDMGQRILSTPNLSTLEGVRNGDLDAEPDLFFYNVNGSSGKFVFDKNKNAVMLNDKNMKVLNSPFLKELGFDYWILGDLYGNRFYFGMDANTIEETSSISYGQYSNKTQSYTSSWYLKKIMLPNEVETIEYNYESGLPTKTTYYNKTKRSTDKMTVTTREEVRFFGIRLRKRSSNITSETVDINEWNNNIEITTTSPKYLKSIVTSDQSAFFDYDLQNPRKDLTNGWLLTHISVKSYTGEILRDYRLNYTYIFSNDPDDLGEISTNNPDKYRVLLTDIALSPGSSIDTNSIVYAFEYNSEFNLPPRYSRRIDHWGYFNNNTRGYFPSENETQKASKEPDELRAAANILKKISYQTGGFKQFLYDGNKYYNTSLQKNVNTGGVRVYQIQNYGGKLDDGTISETYNYNDADSHSTGRLINSIPIYDTFISNSQALALNQKRAFIPFNGSTGNPIEIPSVPGTIIDDFSGTGQYINPSFAPQVPINGIALNAIYYSIKTIFSILDGPTTTVHYGPTKVRSFNTINNIFELDGSSIGYSQITVNAGSEGKTVYKFTDTEDYPDLSAQFAINNSFLALNRLGPDEFPFSPPTSYAFARGKLKEKLVYDRTGILMNKTVYKYGFNADNTSVKGFKCETGSINTVNGGFTSKSNNFFNIGYYDMVVKSLQLKETISEDYFKGNSIPLKKSVVYQYNDAIPSLVSSEKIINSDGVERTSAYKYVLNKNEVSYNNQYEIEAVNALYDKSSYGVLLEQATKQNNELTGIQKNGFKKWTVNNKELILPETLYEGTGTVIEPKMQFEAYDEYGNVLQSSRIQDIKNVTKWSYNNLYPVLECSNAANGEVFYEGFENNTGMGVTTGIAHSGDKYFTGDYNVSFSPEPGKNYKISYWFLLNSKWNYSGFLPYNGPLMLLSEGDAIDDVIVIPQDAQATVTNYHPSVGIASQTDTRGLTVYYEYDNLQRLRLVKDQNKNILKSICYNYTGQEVDCAWNQVVYKNKELSVPVKRNNCPPGYSKATSVTYTVPYGKYTSTVSQADANQQALNDFNTNSEAYANSMSMCIQDVYAKVNFINVTRVVVDGNESSTEVTYEYRGDLVVEFYRDQYMEVPAYPTPEDEIEVWVDIDPLALEEIYPATTSPLYGGYSDGEFYYPFLTNVPFKKETQFRNNHTVPWQITDTVNYNYILQPAPGIIILN